MCPTWSYTNDQPVQKFLRGRASPGNTYWWSKPPVGFGSIYIGGVWSISDRSFPFFLVQSIAHILVKATFYPRYNKSKADVLTALQTLKYLGSKKKLIPFLEKTIKSVVGNDLSKLTFCDLFAGTGTVGRLFKSSVKEVISNDLEYYAFCRSMKDVFTFRLQREAESACCTCSSVP